MNAPSAGIAGEAAAGAVSRRQIRGSSLLLLGRMLSMGMNFAIQVLIVRYLVKSDYGAFAYALSVVGIGETIVTFGLDRAVTRFVPIYHEQGDRPKMLGTLALVVGTMAALGLSLVVLLYALEAALGGALIADEQARTLLLILIFLSPVQALDQVLVGMFAVFASPRAIFFRKHVVAPCLKLAAVLALIGAHAGVAFLSVGYLLAGALGVAIYSGILVRLLRREGFFAGARLRSLEVPWRQVFAFTVPLMTSDLLYAVIHGTQSILLEYFRDTSAVANLRAVQPAAHMNMLVMTSFGTLFTPQAARLFARGDRAGINDLYWQTAVWIAVLSFPIFALTFSLAEPLTVLLFGSEYRDAGVILLLLSFGYYVSAATGMNGLTLKVYGKVKYIVLLNLAMVVLNLLLGLWLIPRHGALGAAVATAATFVVHNVLKQVGLVLGTGIRILDPRYLRVYVTIALAAGGLLAIQNADALPLAAKLVLTAAAALFVVRANRRLLDVERTLPELLRVPLMARLLGR